MEKDNLIKDKSFKFALLIIELTRQLKEVREYEIARQLLRSGTSIGANVEEALAGISKKDFTAKMSIASKEARETNYWLRLIIESKTIEFDYNKYISESESIIKILTAIVKSSQQSIINNQTSNIKNQ